MFVEMSVEIIFSALHVVKIVNGGEIERKEEIFERLLSLRMREKWTCRSDS